MDERLIGLRLVALLGSRARLNATSSAALDPDVRETPIREGDWTPKDHQAHLTAWKARQANRLCRCAARRGAGRGRRRTRRTINAEQQAARADWSWDAISKEADEVSERLIREISAHRPG